MRELLRVEYLITTFFGAGYFPKFPGTFASIVAVLPLLLVSTDCRIAIAVAVLLLGLLAIPLIAKVEKEKGSDSAIIVIDEVLGVWLIFCSPIIPLTWFYLVIGVGLFRVFDILKPSVIGHINKKEGAIYVILDDIVAALASSILLHLIIFILKFAVLFHFIA